MFNKPYEIRNIYLQIRENLKSIYELNEADSIAELLLESKVPKPRLKLISDPNMLINEKDVQDLYKSLLELKANKPIQYVLGETEFMGLKFKVNENVLIPRPETEELISWILKEDVSEKAILDIGTGSGCIPIAIAIKGAASAKVFGMDISQSALEVAIHNAKMNKVDIEFIQDDILSPSASNWKYDIIVSNPPYVRESEKELMAENVLKFEPEIALFVKDSDPLIFYKAIMDFSNLHLNHSGLLFLEINENFGRELWSLLDKNGFREIELRKDMSGKERMIRARKIL
ncbi:peptide chain release factor N(5)-glutamine methyltransferase [Hyphobacterium sp. CCMP332]|nr:peptide chain release factor N(5)-glutamine methyltransferase [Hyphobacterium sp. CCMP332]